MLNNSCSKKTILILGAIIAFGALLRAYNFWKPSLWLDELGTYWVVQGAGIKSVLDRVFPQSPLYHLLAKLSKELLGRNEFALRLPAVLFGTASVYVFFLLGKALFNSTVGLMSALLFAVNINQILFSREARPYSLAVFFALLSILYLLRYLQTKRLKYKLVYCISTALVFYSHYIFIPLLIFESIYVLYTKASNKGSTITLRSWIGSQIIILLMLSPLMIPMFYSYENRGSLNYIQPPTLNELQSQINGLANLPELLIVILIAVILLPFLGGRFQSIRSSVSVEVGKVSFLMFWFLLPILLSFSVSSTASFSVFQISYLLVYLPAANLLQGYLLSLPERVKYKVILFACFTVLYCVHYLPLLQKVPLPYPVGREDWRGAIQELNTRSRTGDLLLLRPGFVEADLLPSTHDARLIEALHATVSDMYLRSSPKIVLLTHTWNHYKFGDYYTYQVKPEILKVDSFWLLDPGYHANVFLFNFDGWLNDWTKGTYQLVFRKNYGIVSLRLYERHLKSPIG